MHDDEQAVQAFLDEFASTWKANDGAALGDAYVPDGSLINPFGQRADGRAGVAGMYGAFFDGQMLAGTTTSISLQRARPVDPDHVFIDAAQTIHGPAGEVVLAVQLAALLRRVASSWEFVDARPYTVASAP